MVYVCSVTLAERGLCSFQPVSFVIVAPGYYDEITVLPSFSDACHFDHSFVCIDTKDTNLCDTKLSPNPTKNGHDTCANRAKHPKFANITNSEDFPFGKILTVGVPDKQKPRAHCPGNVSSAKCRSILPLPVPAENQTTRQPPLCRYPADGSRFVPERRYLRVPAGLLLPACWCHVPADR